MSSELLFECRRNDNSGEGPALSEGWLHRLPMSLPCSAGKTFEELRENRCAASSKSWGIDHISPIFIGLRSILRARDKTGIQLHG